MDEKRDLTINLFLKLLVLILVSNNSLPLQQDINQYSTMGKKSK